MGGLGEPGGVPDGDTMDEVWKWKMRENTPFRKLLRLALFHQGSETGFPNCMEKPSGKTILQITVSQTKQGPANRTWQHTKV